MATTVLMKSAPKPKISLFPNPTDDTYKIWSRLANWSWRFHNKSIEKLIRPDGRVTPKWLFRSGLNSKSSEILWLSCLPANITNRRASLETPFSHYKSTGCFRHLWASDSVGSGPIWLKFDLVRDFMPVLVTSKFEKDLIKTTEKLWRHRFPYYKSIGAFCYHRNHSFDPICTKILCSHSPTQVMIHIKFVQDWPTGLKDIQIQKCGQRTTTDGRSLVYYKLTLWAFGSGELKKRERPTYAFWN